MAGEQMDDFPWIIGEEPAHLLPEPEQPPQSQGRRWWKWSLLALAVLLVVGGLTVRLVALQREGRIRADFQKLVDRERETLLAGDKEGFLTLQDSQNRDGYRGQMARSQAVPWAVKEHGVPFASPLVEVVDVDLHGDVAWVTVQWAIEGKAYRQMRFYRLVDGRWQHTAPDSRFWGQQMERRTSHFR